jgi:hypothetical protein
MSTVRTNAILDASGGNTATINSMTPTADSLQGFRNRIINGDMRIDQRNAGASVTASNINSITYTLDRWAYFCSQASKFTLQQNAASVTPPVKFSNYLGITSSSAYSVLTGDYFFIRQYIEGFNFADAAFGTANATTITLSFWIRSSLTGTFGGALGNSAANRSYPFTYSISVADTWEYKTITIAGDTTGTWVGATNGAGAIINFSLGAGSTFSGTAGAWAAGNFISATGATSVVGTNGATFYITGVQLEVGSVATPFERIDYGRELIMCQRYYYKTFGQEIAPANSAQYTNGIGVPAIGTAYTTSAIRSQAIFPQPMRTTPTITYFNSNVAGSPTANRWFIYIASTATWTNCTAISNGEVSTLYVSPNLDLSGLTAGYSYLVSGFLTASAEL